MAPRKYAIVGTGSRAGFFYAAIAQDFRDTATVVALCDTNQTRMNYANERLEALGHPRVPTYPAADFDRMVREANPDEVIVTTIDRTHDIYITRALALGRNVVTEKPMTIDEARCRAILDAVERAGPQRRLRVTFNYRYAPHNSRVRSLLASGAIGRVTAVHFEWALDTTHGADYFRRWHRDKRNSGGLLVHKSTHHFDLVNFWLADRPDVVYAQGDLRFYGRENAELRGEAPRPFARARDDPEAARRDPFALDLEGSEGLRRMYLEAEREDGYHRDQNVFGDGISIEDTMAVLVRYKGGALLSYSLTAYAPWEGFRVSFTGTQGRLEVEVVERSYVSAAGQEHVAQSAPPEGSLEGVRILVRPHFGPPREETVETKEGGHGGGDPELLRDLFGGDAVPRDELKRAASHVDGALSILTGIAANQSIRTGLPVKVDQLVQIPYAEMV